MLCSGAVVTEVSCAGRAVDVQLRLSAVVTLQPSVVSDRGRVASAEGGYMLDPMLTQSAMVSPDITPDRAPWGFTEYIYNG